MSKRSHSDDQKHRITPRRDDLTAIDKPAHPAKPSPDEARQGVQHDADTQGAAPNRKRPNPEAERPGPTPGDALSPKR
jgi:hypothetical protein